MSMVISNAKLTVLAAVLAAAGTLLNSAGAPLGSAILCAVASFVVLFLLSDRRQAQAGGVLLAALLSCLPVAYFLYAQAREHKPSSNDLVHFVAREVIFTATLDRNEFVSGARELVLNADQLVFPQRQSLSGKTLLSMRNPLVVTANSEVSSALIHLSVRGYIYAPRVQAQPWEYDKRKRLAASGIYSICYLGRGDAKSKALQVIADSSENSSSLTDVMGPSMARFETIMATARRSIVETHRKYLPPMTADLLSSMVLGNRAVKLKDDLTQTFRDVGLSHVLAASGFNLTVVTAMTFFLCRMLTPAVVPANAMCFLAMLSFVSLAGPSPSVLRAALMCTIMLVARSGQRRLLISSTLASAFLITVTADPLCTSDLGLQLSYAATVGIVVGTDALSTQIYSGLSKWRRSIADAFSVVVIAQASVMPIQLLFFWKTGTMFIAANLLATPLVTPVTVLGFASAALCLLSVPQTVFHSSLETIIAFVDAAAFIPLTLMLLMVKSFASCEAAKFSLGPPSVASFVLYYLALVALLASLRIHKHLRWSTAMFTVAACLLLWRPAAPVLTVASVHKQLILIDSSRHAISVGSNKVPDRMIERFVAFNGAKLAPDHFQRGSLPSGLSFVQSKDWLLLYPENGKGSVTPSTADIVELHSLVRQFNAYQIIMLTAKQGTGSRVPILNGFARCNPSESQVKIIGLPDLEFVISCRK